METRSITWVFDDENGESPVGQAQIEFDLEFIYKPGECMISYPDGTGNPGIGPELELSCVICKTIDGEKYQWKRVPSLRTWMEDWFKEYLLGNSSLMEKIQERILYPS